MAAFRKDVSVWGRNEVEFGKIVNWGETKYGKTGRIE